MTITPQQHLDLHIRTCNSIGITWLIMLGVQNQPCLYSAPCKTQVYRFFFLSLHHSNNRLENISIFLLAPFQLSSQKKLFLRRKNIRGVSAPLCTPKLRLCVFGFSINKKRYSGLKSDIESLQLTILLYIFVFLKNKNILYNIIFLVLYKYYSALFLTHQY